MPSSFFRKITKIFAMGGLAVALSISFSSIQAVSLPPFEASGTQPTTSLVACGYDEACKLGDLMDTASKLGSWIIRVIFPAVFFFALFMVILPLLMNPNNPANRTKAKDNLIKLVIGTIIIVGAYFLVRGVLVALGIQNKDIFAPVAVQQIPDRKQDFRIPFIATARAQASTDTPATSTGYFQNPISDTSVQAILRAIMNVLTFAAVILIIMGIIRGVLYLVTSQERPDNLQKGKTWILWSLVAAALVFGAQTFSNLIVDTVQNVFN